MEATCLSGAWGGGSQHPSALQFTMYNYFLTKRLNRPAWFLSCYDLSIFSTIIFSNKINDRQKGYMTVGTQ